METHFTHSIHVYYEDTDFSGVVYHANYLKFFERAREHAIGPARLVWMWDVQALGFAVYQVEMKFNEGARFGDVLDIRSTWEMSGKYRMVWHQEAWRPGAKKAAVSMTLHLVCIDKEGQLRPIPLELLDVDIDAA